MKIWSFVLIALLFAACGEEEDNSLDVDVSDVKLNVSALRMDRDLMNVDTNDVTSWNKHMMSTYGTFWVDYTAGILRQGHPGDPMFPDNFKRYWSLPYISDVLVAVDSVYPEESPELDGIVDGLKHLKYYFPKMVEPRIIYTCNFFNYAGVATDSVLNIGLDFYLGADHWITKSLPTNQFAEFIKSGMDRKYLTVDALSIWFESNYLGTRDFQEMSEALIYYGKLMYALDAMMPKESTHTKFKYTKQEYDWLKKNEHRIWLTMVDRGLVHSTNPMDIKRLCDPGPFTAGLKGNEAPARAGVYIGWRIVQDYMDANPKKKLPDLLKETNSQVILNAYKQGKKE